MALTWRLLRGDLVALRGVRPPPPVGDSRVFTHRELFVALEK